MCANTRMTRAFQRKFSALLSSSLDFVQPWSRHKKTCKMSNILIFFWAAFFGLVVGDVSELRDVKFTDDYNKNEMPPSHTGKPLAVSSIFKDYT